MALKRTEIKRTKFEHKRKKNIAKKERSSARRLNKLANLTEYQIACAKVDIRDQHCLMCGETWRPKLEHHHARFKGNGGKNDIENLALLCGYCHRNSPDAPHQSTEGKNRWVEYLTKMYPDYWRASRKSQEIKRSSRAVEQQEVAR